MEQMDDAMVQKMSQGKNFLQNDLQLQVNTRNNLVSVSLQPPVGTKRTPVDICCVVDTSGSMGTMAQGSNKSGEQDGLSILDVVKHAVKTIIHNLNENDNLSLVNYDDKATVVIGMTLMNENGRNKAIQLVENLQLGGCTNLWDGLHTGLETIRKGSSNKNSSVMLFTDGLPNVEPPRGHIPMLKKYFDEQKLVTQVNTFGFGYSLDSQLLTQIAIEGNGTYAFIPDSGFVGTIFVNALSNMLCTYATRTQVSLEPMNGATFANPKQQIMGYKFQTASWGCTVDVGSVLYDQSRNIVFDMDFKNHKEGTPYLFAKVSYSSVMSQENSQEINLEAQNLNNENLETIMGQYFRLRLIDTVREAMIANDLNVAQVALKNLLTEIEKSETFQKKDAYVKDIYADISGQISEAFSKQEWYNKWGKHYLPSLTSAHLVQQANNFKDPGVQHYGGKLFNSLREIAEDTFIKLPPPKPSIVRRSSNGQQIPMRAANMKSYHSRSAPCFARDSLILMADGKTKLIQDVKKGDSIMGDNGAQKIECVIKTVSYDGKMDLVTLKNGLKITPWHPVLNENGEWVFPNDLGKVQLEDCKEVYSFLLESRTEGKRNTITVNNYQAATFAHGLATNSVIAHDYFGTEKIVQDLKSMKGWENGIIVLQTGCLVKSEQTGLVCTLKQENYINISQAVQA